MVVRELGTLLVGLWTEFLLLLLQAL